MTPVEIIGYAAALVVGLVMGLVGGGGSIITVPVFVYLFDLNPLLATSYSLVVVGSTSLVGTVGYALRGQIDFKITAAFALPSLVSVFITRRVLVPAIPDPMLSIGTFTLPKADAILLFFAFVMILAARAMIRHRNIEDNAKSLKINYLSLGLDGLAVGLLTGTVGAGGGFLIVPMLVVMARLPMPLAVGTSILIIAVNSFVGVLGDVHWNEFNWQFLTTFTSISIVGILVGQSLSKYIAVQDLKKTFGWFVLTVAIFIVGKELFSSL